MREFTNTLSNAKVHGSIADCAEYLKQPLRESGDTPKRGDSDYVMSRSDLLEFSKCPHRWFMGYKDDETTEMSWGSLIDCLVLTPEKFDEQFTTAPATYTNSKGKECEWTWKSSTCREWREEAESDGQSVVDREKLTQAQNAVKFLFGNPRIREYIEGSNKQVLVTAEYRDKDTKLTIPLRGLIDLVPFASGTFGGSLGDFKTCASAAPFAWVKAVFQHGYHIQAALYIDMYVAATGEDRCEFRHIIQESYPPWEIGLRLLSEEFLKLGRETYIIALQRYCQCLKSGEWPGYDHESTARMIIDGWQLTEAEPWMLGQ